MDRSPIFHAIFALILLLITKATSGATFTVINRCVTTIWPGILSNAGSNRLDSTGFELPPGASRAFPAPPNWSGRFWGRTGCVADPATGLFACATGDCGSAQAECNGHGATPPATLAEFTVAAGGMDFYDVSLVDGFNLPVAIEAAGGAGACLSTGCAADLNSACPAELRAAGGQACMSACEAFAKQEYCCSGAFGSPGTCKPSAYSEMFKTACPKSYSYAYDDPTSTFTCSGADYTITFCPTSTSQKSARDTPPPTPTAANGTRTGTGQGFPNGYNNDDPWSPNFLSGDSTNLFSHSSSFHLIITLLINYLFQFL